jgi:hypothetical protein
MIFSFLDILISDEGSMDMDIYFGVVLPKWKINVIENENVGHNYSDENKNSEIESEI